MVGGLVCGAQRDPPAYASTSCEPGASVRELLEQQCTIVLPAKGTATISKLRLSPSLLTHMDQVLSCIRKSRWLPLTPASSICT